jgi:N-glycosylase/DNA lyase
MHSTESKLQFFTLQNDSINLDLIFTSGQTFRWFKDSDYWKGVFGETVLFLKQIKQDQIAWYSPNDPSFSIDRLIEFLHLDVNLNSLFEQWSSDKNIRAKYAEKSGLRLLRQDPNETIFSFICSSNNNIKRISKMVDSLAKNYGKLIWECPEIGTGFYSFPSPKDLLKNEQNLQQDLIKLGFGYRAKFIYASALHMVNEWNFPLSTLRKMPYEELCSILQLLPGVGRKVSDCISLMSCDKFNAVPIDIHMYNISKRDYRIPTSGSTKTLSKKDYTTITNFFQQRFGDYAGWAQLILFAADLKL